jgi:Zn-dependent peptidase ImmA (M78 family)
MSGINVNYMILEWARKTAGLTEAEAAERLGIKDEKYDSAVEILQALEKGKILPSRTMLLKMVTVYRRPLVLFYMSDPPKKGNRGKDFRTLPADFSEAQDALTDALIRNVLARQSLLRSAIEDDEDAQTIKFVGIANEVDGVNKIVILITQILDMDHEDFYSQSDQDKAFALLRTNVEQAGVFVLLMGNLGSHHTAVKPEVFRGFALADKLAPFIVINEQDSHAAWSFTLIHELTHILFGQSGISGGFPDEGLEKLCNDVASEYLLPNNEVLKLNIDSSATFRKTADKITEFAKRRNLSSSMVAYRLFRQGTIRKSTWIELRDYYHQRWLEAREKERKKAKNEESEDGPRYYTVRRHRVGVTLIGVVNRMLSQGSLTTIKAGQVLGVRARNVRSLVEMIH